MDNEKKIFNLSHPQKRVWFTEKLAGLSILNNIGGVLKIHGSIDISIMKRVLNDILQQNSALRIRIIEESGQASQYIEKYEYEDIDVYDFNNQVNPVHEFEEWAKNTFHTSYITINSKLYYFSIFKISDNLSGVLVRLHHIVADGWAVSLIEKQICEKYSNYMKNKCSIATPNNYTYFDYIENEKLYLNSARCLKNKKFWITKFKECPHDFFYESTKSVDSNRITIKVDDDTNKNIRNFISNERCSINSFFIYIVLIYMYKITGKNDIVIGMPVFNRVNKKQKSIVGMFTSTIPLRFKVSGNLSILDMLKELKLSIKDVLKNQQYPYDLLVKDLSVGKDGYDNLFKISVNYYNSSIVNKIDDIDCEVSEYISGCQNYSLQLVVNEWNEHHVYLNFDYKTSEYNQDEIYDMYNKMLIIIKQVLSNSCNTIDTVGILSEEEKKYKIYTFNDTDKEFPKKKVVTLFQEQADISPEKVALVFEKKSLTYRELNDKSNQLARYLISKGVKMDSVVGILETHSMELIISILGVMKTGAAYIPISLDCPHKRIDYMLKDSQCKLLLTNVKNRFRTKEPIDIININEENFDMLCNENLTMKFDMESLAYIIYTSGTTGAPKGVMIKHVGLTNYIWWAMNTYFKGEEVMALYSSISFDLTVTSIFTPLISGNQIHIYDNSQSEFVLYRILEDNKTTVLKLTPSHLALLEDRDNSNSSIKRIIVGGEDLKVSLSKSVLNSFKGQVEIYNEYGPTEAVVGCMIYRYNPINDNRTSVPIGCPINNMKIYLLDEKLNVVSNECNGEIYISSFALARGYLNLKELTKQKFIKNPFLDGEILYKTGDLARYTKNGDIEYVGRVDHQVKIRGHRIELGEIENYLIKHESIKDAVVKVRNQGDTKILVAYVVSKEEVSSDFLREYLAKFIPFYMMPSIFLRIEKIPLTKNGKIDDNALPEPIVTPNEFIPSESDMEKVLARALEEVIGVSGISMNSNFYELGGDSIKAIQVQSLLKEYGYKIQMSDLLSFNTLRELSKKVERENQVKRPLDICKGYIHFTPITSWFFSTNHNSLDIYNQYVALKAEYIYNIKDLELAMTLLIRQHDVLRLNYDKKEGKLYYNNRHLNERIIIQEVNLNCMKLDSTKINIPKVIEYLGNKQTICDSLLIRLAVLKDEKPGCILLFIAHHLVVDGVSWRILLNDFISIMNSIKKNESIKLPMRGDSYQKWSESLFEYSNHDFIREIDYWNSIIEKNGWISKDTYVDKIESRSTSSNLSFEIDMELVDRAFEQCNHFLNMKLDEFLICVLVISVHKITNASYVIIELEKHGREKINEDLDISHTVGWFTYMYPAYFDCFSEDLGETISYLKEQLRYLSKEGVNYGVLKYMKHVLKTNENKYVRFNYMGDFDNILLDKNCGVNIEDCGLYSVNSNLSALLDINVILKNGALHYDFLYSQNVDINKYVYKLKDCYIEVFKTLLDFCDSRQKAILTPSDFLEIDISQDEISKLFN